MKRGDLILLREPGTPAAKARPCVVVQRGAALGPLSKVTACPLTSALKGSEGQRPVVTPSAENRLRVVSEIEVDWIYTHPLSRVAGVIGSIDPITMQSVDQALRRWLAL